MNVFGAAGISLVFVAVGGGMLLYARSLARKARQSLSWPTTAGVISHAAVLFRTERGTQPGNAPGYKADIAYRFKVKGRDYSSSQITLMDYSSSSAGGQKAWSPAIPTARRSRSATTPRIHRNRCWSPDPPAESESSRSLAGCSPPPASFS